MPATGEPGKAVDLPDKKAVVAAAGKPASCPFHPFDATGSDCGRNKAPSALKGGLVQAEA
ncbi:MAG: hypothetical protein NTU41_14240 [Chloroflexi bacterium]|nr:hypothetical protein [Chloroflexota bacterium]